MSNGAVRSQQTKCPTYEVGRLIPGTIYRVVRLIGQGGMGTVYEVEDTTVAKLYVLKTLHAELSSRHDLADRMDREARILARLNHPNIVEVITQGTTGDAARLRYYVMQKLSGFPLRTVLSNVGRLGVSHSCNIAVELLCGLAHAHSHNVIHRDVKPENIFIHRCSDGRFETKLLDFGIMTYSGGQATEPCGKFTGTLLYASPEQLQGQSKLTARSDLYSVGLVLYEMLAGRGPFAHEGGDVAVSAAHLLKDPPPISAWARVPQELDELVHCALAKEPAARPPTAAVFANLLRSIALRSASLSDCHRSVDELLARVPHDRVGPGLLGAAAIESDDVNTRPMTREESADILTASVATQETTVGSAMRAGNTVTASSVAPPTDCPWLPSRLTDEPPRLSKRSRRSNIGWAMAIATAGGAVVAVLGFAAVVPNDFEREVEPAAIAVRASATAEGPLDAGPNPAKPPLGAETTKNQAEKPFFPFTGEIASRKPRKRFVHAVKRPPPPAEPVVVRKRPSSGLD